MVCAACPAAGPRRLPARLPRLLPAALLVLAALAAPAASHAKRAEMSPAPFVMGTRYGRSGPRLILPRNDKFFMNSRYGKRSEPPLPTRPLPAPPAPPRSPRALGLHAARPLSCEYTGVFPLYRCQARVPYYRRRYDDPGASDV